VPSILAQDAVNHIGMQVPTCLKAFQVGPDWPKEWSLGLDRRVGHPMPFEPIPMLVAEG
jgi:hypothetical protein